MSVIPAWADEKAASLIENFGFDLALLSGAIAGALVLERERCAKVAEGFEQNRDWVPTSLYAAIRQDVADRIRKGPPA